MSWADALNTPVNTVTLDTPKVYDLPAFDYYKDPQKLEIISKIAESEGRDPRLATLAVSIFRRAGIQSRDYVGQARALLKYVQETIYYVNEPDERLQTPSYTLRVGYGDCDDCAILLYALARSVRLPAKLVISGTTKDGKKVRYHQGDPRYPSGVHWAHIYLMIGDRPYGPPRWSYAEPTLRNVPLGWDVVGGDSSMMPEMGTPTETMQALATRPHAQNTGMTFKDAAIAVAIGVVTILAANYVNGVTNKIVNGVQS